MTSIFDYSATPTSNTGSPPTGFGTGQTPSNVRVMLQDILGEVTEFVHSAVAGGTADALTVTLTNVPASLTDGMQIHVRAAAANATTTPTLNLNALGAKTITKLGGTALVAGDIAGNLAEHTFRYNLANTRWELVNPAIPVADATNGGIAVTAAKPATLKIAPSDLLTKATPTTSDSIVIQDAAASNAAKTATLPAVVGALFSPITNSLGADVLLNNTASYFDGPSVAQGATGTWLVMGTVTLDDTAAQATYSVKLWDGTTVIDSSTATQTGASFTIAISLSGFIASPAGNLRISVKDTTATTGLIKFNVSGNSKDSTITAIRIA